MARGHNGSRWPSIQWPHCATWQHAHKCHPSPPNLIALSPWSLAFLDRLFLWDDDVGLKIICTMTFWNKGPLKTKVTLLAMPHVDQSRLLNRLAMSSVPPLARPHLSSGPYGKQRSRSFSSLLNGIISVWLCLLSHRFSGLASLSLSLVAPDNHCIGALFSHRCGNHYGSWSPWQHTVPIPPSRTEGGIKQHALCCTHTHNTLLTHTSFALVVHAHARSLSTQIAFSGKSKKTFRCYRGRFKKK